MREFNFFYNLLNLNDYKIKDFFYSAEFVIYSIASFFIPFYLAHPQLLVGSIVNCFLALAAFNLKVPQILPIIFLPSLGVFFAGLIFGNLSPQLIFFIPFIWIANFLYVFLIKYFSFFKLKKKIFAILIASISKSLFLFLVAFVLISISLVSSQFLTFMGILQLQTALIGGSLALIFQTLKRKLTFVF
ncbi:MAG: hypothetical protein QXG16_03010 [Candidatus Anstonellaceae archaeon]